VGCLSVQPRFWHIKTREATRVFENLRDDIRICDAGAGYHEDTAGNGVRRMPPDLWYQERLAIRASGAHAADR